MSTGILHIYIYIYIHICISLSLHIYVYICMSTYIYIYIYTHVYTFTYISTHAPSGAARAARIAGLHGPTRGMVLNRMLLLLCLNSYK